MSYEKINIERSLARLQGIHEKHIRQRSIGIQ